MHPRRTAAPGGAHRDRPGVASWLAAATLLALAVPVMHVSAFGVYYLDDPGLARLRNMAPGLTLSAVVGLGTATAIRWLLGGPCLSGCCSGWPPRWWPDSTTPASAAEVVGANGSAAGSGRRSTVKERC